MKKGNEYKIIRWIRRIWCWIIDHDWIEVFAGHEPVFSFGEMQYEAADSYKDVCYHCCQEKNE